jgi:hypothetical protein
MSEGSGTPDTPLNPELVARIETLAEGRASGLRMRNDVLSLVLDVGGLTEEKRDGLAAQIVAFGTSQPGIEDVRVAMTAERSARPAIIAVGSGKGGVGKSTLSVNLAVALKAMGKRVGMVDADIYGPSLPRLLDSEGSKPQAEGNRLIPVQNAQGIPMLSMGHLAKAGQAIAWRGPMAGNALGQLLDADWSGTDLLIVDLPPGTGVTSRRVPSSSRPRRTSHSLMRPARSASSIRPRSPSSEWSRTWRAMSARIVATCLIRSVPAALKRVLPRWASHSSGGCRSILLCVQRPMLAGRQLRMRAWSASRFVK